MSALIAAPSPDHRISGSRDMTAQARTIAVVGSTPFAWLLAGLLASDHSRAIVLVSPAPDPQRLIAVPSLSISALTRPETLALLADAQKADAKRISRIAPNLLRRGNLALFGSTPASRAALGHMRHAMTGFGHVVEPIRFAPTGEFRIRDIWHFNAEAFEAAAPAWLASNNVAVVNSSAGLKLGKDGTASFGATRFDCVVLADDRAIIDRLSEKEVASFARPQAFVGLRTASTHATPDRVRMDIDTGAFLARGETGQWEGFAANQDGKGMERIRACLPEGMQTRLAARTHFMRLLTHDDAPVVGQTRRSKAFVIAGLGVLDIALAPLLARLIAGAASPAEARWGEAHAASLRQPRRDVAEFAPERIGAVQ